MDEQAIIDILEEGAKRAKEKADKKLLEAKKAVGVI